MYVPSFFVGLSLVLAVANAVEKDGAPYPVDESSSIGSGSPGSSSYSSLSTPEGYPDCYVRSPHWVGDGWCDNIGIYNTEACGYDGGDCCECDCSHGDYLCGTITSYACVNPSSNCPSECSNGLAGFEGSNDVGSACCPLGCNQCGGAGCAQSGAGQGLGSTDCCVNGVLNHQEFCTVTGAAPCIIEEPVPECIEGIDGLLGENDSGSVCCPIGCTQCGGLGCSNVGADEGLGSTDCCINGVLNNQELCSESGGAPCIVETFSECSDGTPGIEGSNDNGAACCPIDCTQCGGAGCATSGSAAGLGSADCCINGVLNNQDFCESTGAAPCFL